MTELKSSVPVFLGEVEAVLPAHSVKGGDDGAGWTQTGQHTPHRRLANLKSVPSLRLRVVLVDRTWRKSHGSDSHAVNIQT